MARALPIPAKARAKSSASCKRDDAAHGKNGQRCVRAGAVAALGIGGAGGGQRVRHAANAEGPRHQERQRVGADHARRARCRSGRSRPRSRRRSAGAPPARRRRTPPSPCRRRRDGRCRSRSCRLEAVQIGATSVQSDAVHAHLERAPGAGRIRRRACTSAAVSSGRTPDWAARRPRCPAPPSPCSPCVARADVRVERHRLPHVPEPQPRRCEEQGGEAAAVLDRVEDHDLARRHAGQVGPLAGHRQRLARGELSTMRSSVSLMLLGGARCRAAPRSATGRGPVDRSGRVRWSCGP